MSVTLSREPILVSLGGRTRELQFNLNTSILLRGRFHGAKSGELLHEIAANDDGSRKYEVNYDNLRAYAWAALHEDGRLHGEILTEEDVGAMIPPEQIDEVLLKVSLCVNRFYGSKTPKGEASAATATANVAAKAGAGKKRTSSAAGK